MPRIKQLGRNYQFLALNNIIKIIVSFVLFPFIVSHTGKELYGAYLLALTITGYFSLFDLGVRSAVSKFIPEYRGKNDTEGLHEIINASFSFFVVYGLIAAGILCFLGSYGPSFFKTSPTNKVLIQQLFWIFAATAVFVWPLQVFRGGMGGLQRYDWEAGVGLCTQICYVAGVYLLLSRGFGIIQLAILRQVLNIISGLIFYIVMHHHIPGLKLKFPYFHKKVFRKIFSFSIYLFLIGITGVIILNVDDLVIGALVSVSAIAIYKVSYNLQTILRTINGIIGGPLYTLCAEMEGASEYEKQRTLLLKGTKYMTLLVLPMILIIIIFSKPFILNWVGESFREAILPAQVLLFFWLFNITLEVGTGALVAKGIVQPILWIAIANATCNLALSLVLTRYLGILGVALGTTIPMVLINFPLIMSLVLRTLKVKFIELFSFSIRNSILMSLLAAVSSMTILKFIEPINIFWVLIEMAFIYSIIMFCNFFFVLSSAERVEVKKMLAFEGLK
ncbi:oligosaccharide flippase family protein [bacterium]|nr:oligosaccharide flippase family protein [bacterium]